MRRVGLTASAGGLGSAERAVPEVVLVTVVAGNISGVFGGVGVLTMCIAGNANRAAGARRDDICAFATAEIVVNAELTLQLT